MKPAAPVMTTRFLVGMLVEEPAQQRQPHDFQVEPHRPVLDVIQVVLDPLLDRGVAAPAVHLRPAGDARLHFVAQHVLGNLVLELRDEQRPLGPRADDRHIALEDVPQLRQFVDVGAPQHLADRRPPRVLLAREHWPGHRFGIVEHRAELVDHERLAVEAHPLLTVEHRSARRELHQHRDQPEGNRQHDQRGARDRNIDDPFDDAVEALERDVVDVDDRDAVEILEARPQRDHLQQVGHDLDIDAFAARRLDELQHLHVLLGRQRDVQMIDSLARRDLRRFVRRAEQRQAAIPQMIAGGLVVDEADDQVAKLAMFEDLVGDKPAKLAGTGDEDALETDAGAPAAFEDLADELARRVGERNVQDQEDAPDRLRDLEHAAILRGARGEVGLHIQGRDDAEDHRQDAADEDREEIVDARAAAAQAIQPLQLEPDRNEDRNERQHVDVLPQRRHAFGDRDHLAEAGMEAERVGDHERQQRQQRVRQDVERDEQAVVAIYHDDGSATSAAISSPKRERLNCSAWRRIVPASNRRSTASATASANASADSSSTNSPVSPGFTVSSAPPRLSATTGRPHACASSGTIPKSSSPGSSATAARRYSERMSSSETRPRKRVVAGALRSSAARSGPSPTIVSGTPARVQAAIATSMRLYGTSAETTSANRSGVVASG